MTHIYMERSTSAGYRVKLPRPTSAYHEKCIPASQRATEAQVPMGQHVTHGEGDGGAVVSSTGRPFTRKDYEDCNKVIKDKTWRESCARERNAVTKWEQTCGFMKNFDEKGNLKERPDTPSNLSVYSDDVPNTSNQRVGHWQNKSKSSRSMVSLQNRLCQTNRRKHHKDLLCYD